jgi:hypothetical protein
MAGLYGLVMGYRVRELVSGCPLYEVLLNILLAHTDGFTTLCTSCF